MKFDFVPLHKVVHEIDRYVPIHNEDVTDQKANVDWDYYVSASMQGQCHVVTMRDSDILVGYSVFTTSANPMHKHRLEATNDALFIAKDYRGKYASELIKKSNEYLKSIGINEVSYLLNNDRVGKLLARNKFESKYKLWSIEL